MSNKKERIMNRNSRIIEISTDDIEGIKRLLNASARLINRELHKLCKLAADEGQTEVECEELREFNEGRHQAQHFIDFLSQYQAQRKVNEWHA
jgi:hypothetical protein